MVARLPSPHPVFILFSTVLLFSVASVAPVAAQHFGRNKVQYERFDFQRLQTENFDVYYYPEKTEAANDVARMAERWYARLRAIFQHEFADRKPIILYADDTDFQQTNVIGGFIGEGTGGVTEGRRDRLIMPLTGSYRETDRILGHEMVHVFQFDIWKTNPNGFRLSALPLWFIEGTAEYLSLGRVDPHTSMWMRDAVLNDQIPTTRQLTREQHRFFPYRYGQALMAYIAGRWGDGVLGTLYRQAGRSGLEATFQHVLGVTGEQLSEDWAAALRETKTPQLDRRTRSAEAGERVLTRETVGGRMNLSPAISPDGRYVAFFSERGLFSVDLYVADAETGEVIRRLTRSGTSAHFDAIRFISSAGTWSPDGRRLAFVTFRQGNNQIAVLDARTRRIEQRYRIEDVSAISNPAWSPDGRRIAFSGTSGGLTNLYVLDRQSGDVRQLTNDRHAVLQPNWSPDGEQIAFVTDRGSGTSFTQLTFAPMRIGVLDVATEEVRMLPLFANSKNINPQFAPDGQSLYFIAEPDGFSDIYRYALDEDQIYRVTRLATGVSGIMSLSPALSVARQAQRMLFSVYEANGYNVFGLDLNDAQGEPVDRTMAQAGGQLPPIDGERPGFVSRYLRDASGLPEQRAFESEPYRPRLLLEYIGTQGGVGVGYTSGVNRFNTQIGGGITFLWNDFLNNHMVGLAVQANGTFKDIGGMVMYQNLTNRLQWGPSLSHIPMQSGSWRIRREPVQVGDQVFQGTRIDQVLQRTFVDQAAFNVAYPLTMNQRLEASAGFTRFSYDFEIETLRLVGNRVVAREFDNVEAPPGLNFFDASTAFVGDFSFGGFTSPIRGRRYRFEASSRVGDLFYQSALADYRQYLFLNPVTFAMRGLHVGRYGQDAEDRRITPQFLGQGTLMRGYSYFTFDPIECGTSLGDCPVFDRLNGSRLAVASAELRVPLLGTQEFGLIDFPYLPTELTAFVDGGLAWSSEDPPVFELTRQSDERIPVFSTGLSTRVNVLGALIVELMYVFPFQRPDKGWHFDFQISPGW